jgi:predicted aconitase with swiveling domain
MLLSGRTIHPGVALGPALVTQQNISFFGGVDPDTGVVVEGGHELEGQSLAGKILVFPTGKGSTVGSYTLYRLKKNGVAPAAIVNAAAETITAVGCIIAGIPCVDQLPLSELHTGQRLLVDAARGQVEILPPFFAPPEPLPEPLRGLEPGTFTEDTMYHRLPGIARRVLGDGQWSPAAAAALQALADEMPHTPVRAINDPDAPDSAAWAAYMQPYIGQNWLEMPWFPAEAYFFRRILEATGYYGSGPHAGFDPYASQKQAGLAEIPPVVNEWAGRLEQLLRTAPDDERKAAFLADLLRAAVWGNQADLSVWPGGSAPNRPQQGQSEHLLVDGALPAMRRLAAASGPSTSCWITAASSWPSTCWPPMPCSKPAWLPRSPSKPSPFRCTSPTSPRPT